MACILVVAECEDGARLRLVLDEYVTSGDLASDDSCARLIERLGWGIVEAEELEVGDTLALGTAQSTPRGNGTR